MNSKHRRLTVAIAVFGATATLLASQPALAQLTHGTGKTAERSGDEGYYTRNAPSILPDILSVYDKIKNFMLQLQQNRGPATYNKV